MGYMARKEKVSAAALFRDLGINHEIEADEGTEGYRSPSRSNRVVDLLDGSNPFCVSLWLDGIVEPQSLSRC